MELRGGGVEIWLITGAVDQSLKKAAEVRGGWGTGNGYTIICYLYMSHIPFAMWYFRAPHLRGYMDLVNHNLCVEMTITIDHCQLSYRIGHSNLWLRVSFNKHSLNSTINRTGNIKNRTDLHTCIKARKVACERSLHKCLSIQWA